MRRLVLYVDPARRRVQDNVSTTLSVYSDGEIELARVLDPRLDEERSRALCAEVALE